MRVSLSKLWMKGFHWCMADSDDYILCRMMKRIGYKVISEEISYEDIPGMVHMCRKI